MGSRGPAPKRSSEVKGHHRGADPSKGVTKGVARRTTRPDPSPDWSPFAVYVFEAFGRSGMVDFAQDTDWAAAWLLAENVNDYLRTSRRSAMAMAEIRQMMGALAFTEADRRRAGIELEEEVDPGTDRGVQGVESARARLTGKAG